MLPCISGLAQVSDRARFWGLAVSHALVALIYKHLLGVAIPDSDSVQGWEWMWHVLPVSTLTESPITSVWHMHSQPPLHNLYGAVFWNLFGDAALTRMHDANIVLGALLCGMTYIVARSMIGSRAVALVVAAAITLHPAVFLFEAYSFYTIPAAFLITTSAFALARLRSRQDLRWVGVFVLSLNLLILTRSMYHLVLLLFAMPLVCVIRGHRWRSTLLLALAISSLSTGWYTKNYVQYGFFGGSSWGGMILWQTARWGLSDEDLQPLVASGELDAMVVDVEPYEAPSVYSSYGYDRRSEIPSLARDDLHNINIVDISACYGDNALRVIRSFPGNYVERVGMGFRTFCRPSSRHRFLQENRERISVHVELYAGLLLGDWLAQYVRGITGGKGDFGSFLLLLYPLAAGTYLFVIFRRCRFSRRAWLDYARAEGPMLFSFGLIVYTTLVGCGVAYGENERFKFGVEPILWAFLVAVAWRRGALVHGPGPSRDPTRLPAHGGRDGVTP